MDTQLESILDSYAASEPGPSRATVADWIREYPQFARELTEFVARWQLLEWADGPLGGDAAAEVADDDPFFLRAMSAAQSAFYAARADREAIDARQDVGAASPANMPPPPCTGDAPTLLDGVDAVITGFTLWTKRAGLSVDDVIDRVGLSHGLFRKIDRRLIDPSTIPIRVIEDLASAIMCRASALIAYTRGAPSFPMGAQYRSNQAPALPGRQEDFFDAVRNDLAIDESRRKYLLSLRRPDVDEGAQRTAGTTKDL